MLEIFVWLGVMADEHTHESQVGFNDYLTLLDYRFTWSGITDREV